MMALLYETVPTFEDTWIECFGDLGRYRMAMEDLDMDRELSVNTDKICCWLESTGLDRPDAPRQLHAHAYPSITAHPLLGVRTSFPALLESTPSIKVSARKLASNGLIVDTLLTARLL